MRKYITALAVVVVVFATLSVVSTSDSVQAVLSFNDYPWTTIASDGTVDEGDISIYQVNGANMDIKSTAKLPAYLDVRYNVVAVGQLLHYSPWGVPNIKVRYRDNGANASVYLYLKEVNLTTGVERTMLTFNSNSFPSSNSIQTQEVINCDGWQFNFWKNAYYIDARIYKIGTGGTPLLNTIQVTSSYCLY